MLSREHTRKTVILAGSFAFFAFWVALLLPMDTNLRGGYLVAGEVKQANDPKLVFAALMAPEYNGPKDRTFSFQGICNESISVPLEAPVSAIKTVVTDRSAKSLEIKDVAKSLGADLVGICELDPRWKFKGVPLDHKYAVVIAEALPYYLCKEQEDNIKAMLATRATLDFYRAGGKVALFLAKAIWEQGYPARAHYESWSQVMTIPIAIDAGLGELGRNGMLITPEFGPRCRISIVTTDLPLEPDKPKALGITETCQLCDKCALACPAKAIPKGSETLSGGVSKWPVDMEKCFNYWYKGENSWIRCLTCMTSCPWNKPDNLLHRIGIFLASRSSFSRWLLVKVDDVMGYGQWVDTLPKETPQ
ncbi:4Fe-4S dicluster domain-containing protein [Desulfomonile tiedjei]|uniref:4Fe-4S dicluster domain-containing protein n=1 Tax=Desulfomonile tiedjei TaxID=2358 RepID=UPI0002F2F5DB|nr:reductive dehalogenase domain-containing protein [Desulfomonile tiedjei]